MNFEHQQHLKLTELLRSKYIRRKTKLRASRKTTYICARTLISSKKVRLKNEDPWALMSALGSSCVI